MKGNNKAITVGVGRNCPKCFQPTEIKKHPPHWINRKNFYYTQWDFCKKCNAVYFQEQYKSSDWQEEDRQQDFFRGLRNEI